MGRRIGHFGQRAGESGRDCRRAGGSGARSTASGEAGAPVGEGDVEYNGVAEPRRTWAADSVEINSTAEQALQITPGHWLAIGGGAHRPGHRRAK